MYLVQAIVWLATVSSVGTKLMLYDSNNNVAVSFFTIEISAAYCAHICVAIIREINGFALYHIDIILLLKENYRNFLEVFGDKGLVF